ncbi:MAG: tetratricopeptide (TPR) repeat protein [Rickettsiales bacterium]|jgi:tetratricopeptide (TPR) repeat protein
MRWYIAISIFLLISSKTLANEALSNQKIIGDIERHLFFDKETNKVATTESTYDGGDTIFEEDAREFKSKFDIIAIDANFDTISEEKKKLAHNASLIGHYEVSIKLYKEILAKDKFSDSAKFGLAFSYQNLHQYSEAKDLYYDLLKTGKKINKDQVVDNLLSIIIEENPKEAIFFLTKLSAQHPNSASLIAKSALTYAKINKPKRAIDLMQKALFLDPGNFQYQYNLAIMLDKDKNYQDAKSLYNKILSKLSRSKSEKLDISLDAIYKRTKYLERSI